MYSKSKRKRKKKRNINNNLAVLPSYDKSDDFTWSLLVKFLLPGLLSKAMSNRV